MYIEDQYMVSFSDKNKGLIETVNFRDNIKQTRHQYRFDRFRDAVRFAKHRYYDNPDIHYDYKDLSYPAKCFVEKELYNNGSYDELITQLRHCQYLNMPRPDFGNIEAAYNIMVNDLISLGYVDVRDLNSESIQNAFKEHKNELYMDNMQRRGFSVYVNNRQVPDLNYSETNELDVSDMAFDR